jgi:LuxR family maltose regulon positive regulatory protein
VNALLIPLDERREWYRYHHLFVELLRHELGRRDPGSVARLHGRAAGWLMGAGLVSEAVRQMVAAGDMDRVAEVVVSDWLSFANSGERGAVAEWFAAIPDERLRRDGALCVARAGLAITVGDGAGVLPWLDRAERAASRNPAEDRAVWLEGTAIRASALRRLGDVGQARRIAERMAPLDGTSPWHSAAASVLGSAARWQGDDATAIELLEQAVCLGHARFPMVAVFCYGQRALIAADRGDWDACEATVEAAFGLIDNGDLDEYWMGAPAHVANGRLFRHARRPHDAEAELARAVVLGQRGVGVIELAYSLLMLADLRRELGDRVSARELVVEARGLLDRAPDPGPVVPRLIEQAERSLRLVHHSQNGFGSPVFEELTVRERAVLYLLPGSLSAREIGDELGVTRNTIKTHTKSLYRKLGATGRREAVARGRLLGLL